MILARSDWLEPPKRPGPEPAKGTTFSGKCVGVTDGDTIRVMYEGREVKVRLYGVDAPEKRQPYGAAAKKFASGMVFGKPVVVSVRDRDRYGRSVGWVKTAGGEVLNLALVRAGLAWWYRDYAPNDHDIAEAQRQARRAGLGLWSQRNPVPPWEYRKQRRSMIETGTLGPVCLAGCNVPWNRTGAAYGREVV